ncbi:hypothetical protein BESB_085330 [Besnoitia besnoiti]|uniref:Replication factor Mcm10 C-terminal domain-containing protein n=1 Tax=Besnoitia besnoiti TaxID=94643 RepID=A0A2A9M850_BESBE|nr:hypothetical protein BESB_085330 [Besnoitia besnoiti]PFH33334.1 hypothetical protein BESB_085330 [Besnoitia besnoiti]
MAPPPASGVAVQEDGTLRYFGTPLTLREWRLPLSEARGLLKSSAETEFLPLASLARLATHANLQAAKTAADVAILGVVSDVGAQRPTEKGCTWAWTLWDLQETKVKLLLRGEGLCKALYSESVKPGMLVAVLNPTLLEPNPQYDSRCVAVDKVDHVLLIGGVNGVMRCGAMTKKQTPCSMMVFVPTMGEFCRFHVSSRAARSQDARVKSRIASSSSSSSASSSSVLSSSGASAASVQRVKLQGEASKPAASTPALLAPHRRLLHGSGVHTAGLDSGRVKMDPSSLASASGERDARSRSAGFSFSSASLKLKENEESRERQEARIALLLRANPALRKANDKVAQERQLREAGGVEREKKPAAPPTMAFARLKKSVEPSASASASALPQRESPSLPAAASTTLSSHHPVEASPPSSGVKKEVADAQTVRASSASPPPRLGAAKVERAAVAATHPKRDAAAPLPPRPPAGGGGLVKKEKRDAGTMLMEHLSAEQKKDLSALSNEFVRRRYLRLFYEINNDQNTPGNRSLFDELSSVRMEMKSFTRQDFQVMGLVDLMPPLCLHPDQTIAELALVIWRAAHFRLQATVNSGPAVLPASPAPSALAAAGAPEKRNLRADEVNRRLAVDLGSVKDIFKKRQKEEKKRQREMDRERAETEKRVRQREREDAKHAIAAPLAARSAASVQTPADREKQKEMLQEIMSVRSNIQAHVEKADFEEEQQILKMLEKQDAREEFKQSIKEIQIEAFFCTECNEYCDKMNPVCRQAGHKIERRKAPKRFFRCPECMYSPIIAIGHTLPDGCPKCRVALANLLLPAVSAYKPKALKPLDHEKLTITGDDEDPRCRSRVVKAARQPSFSDDWDDDSENLRVTENALET